MMYGQSFLQSAEWEVFQKTLERKTWRVGGALLIRHDLPSGKNYLYCPRPDFKNQSDFDKFLEGAEEIAKEEESIFLKIEPMQTFSIQHSAFSISDNLQPQKTIIIGLPRPEETILSVMHPKTRYNIRLAARHGVTVLKGDASECAAFCEMLAETARREDFSPHGLNHYQKLLGIRTENFWNELFFAEFRGKKLAAALVNFYRPLGTATYLHGASSREHKEVMAPHLLHWEIVRAAMAQEFNAYDFWGIDKEKWPGVTRFKSGFGGAVVEYPKAVDVIFCPAWYRAYRFLRGIKRKIL